MPILSALLRPTPRITTHVISALTKTSRVQPIITRRCLANGPGRHDPDREPIRLLSEVDVHGKKLPAKDGPEEYSKGYRTFAIIRLILGLGLMGALVYDMVNSFSIKLADRS